ncbi:multiple inositol polyphosphate phosphatase 1-like isoform X3 [Hyposmocoma kahamanoa]|uniref:multiple inositol polyphosphate phosphatase 1-like isoform X3 n=1 Tax=Hyposmocoma kahamanoa TaxID=1477025 RepID=UPI000E6D89C3|nr:multiple inositol polyphosphate phosphatase 1-like isoform X3 [Hyposmocoma kahamanoa]
MNVIATSVLFVLLFEFSSGVVSLKSHDVRNYLGTRTPYRFRYNKNDSKIKYPQCNDSKIWMIARHGTRLPSAKDIVGMNTTLKDLKFEILLAHQQGKGDLSKEQLQQLQLWSSDLDPDKEKYLTREGQDEMILLAERMHKRFPNAVKHNYDNQTFLFKYTATERAQQSARYFTIGLFDRKDAQGVIFAPTTKIDPILRVYTVNLMYKICGFETSWSKYHMSPWCYAFNQESAEKMEYYHDLKHYWMDGYGHDLTYRQACLAIKNMFENFSSNQGPNATFLFAHSGTLLKILAHLQLYKPDQPLRGNTLLKDRHWKTSHIDCFASNLAFVLFECKEGDHVLALHQEQVIKLPMCKEELCPLKTLLEYFYDSIYNCDYSDMCSLSNEKIAK